VAREGNIKEKWQNHIHKAMRALLKSPSTTTDKPASPTPFFQKRNFGGRQDHMASRRFFQACGGSPAIQLQEGSGSDIGIAQQSELKSIRFQNDPVLELVMKNMLTLKKGKRGPQIDVTVAKVQRALIDAGFPLPKFGPDGIFGSETEEAVKQFQASKNLSESEQDGKVGPITLGLLDDHFADRTKTGLLQESTETGDVKFSMAQPVNPFYSNPDPFLQVRGDALRLHGPSFSFPACVLTGGNNVSEAKKWDAGHIQDITDAEMLGQYSDDRKKSFVSPLPIRDSAPVQRLFPWYNPNDIAPTEIGQSCTRHTDDPGVQFPIREGDATLQSIQMKFKAIDWVVVRNRNTGEIKFLHHAEWGFDQKATLDPANVPEVEPEINDNDVVVTPVSNLPEPEGTVDDITHDEGRGSSQPCMTEGVFNEEVRLENS
jgi:hypothetical protein